MHPSITKHIKNYVNPTAINLQLFNSDLNEIAVSKGVFLLKLGAHVQHKYLVTKGYLKYFTRTIK
jgi:hypothetical protein